ncbi:MAG: phenylalanine--tRNA ligase subunit beta [Parcubacteria group bacterium]|nr:phenylalanine--tRNA ligase subunit beta [Parcubacteria group bacterium]
MKFSYSWLKDLLKLKESPEKLAELLTLYLAETTVLYHHQRPILDIDLLPNRFPDVSSHLGLAREIGAILDKKFIYPQIKLKEDKNLIREWVVINNKSKNCRQYVSRCIWHVKVKPSPQWLKERLIDCGLRPINNVVDAANYIMLLTGQPLHVFDFQKVASSKQKKKEIIIRQARAGEKITTLEKKTYSLSKNVLLICDQEKPLAIAGIKGGIAAEVDKKTTFIILESANFDPVNIRLTSRELGLITDASLRFEHDLNPLLTEYAIDLLAALIQEIAGGSILKGRAKSQNYSPKKITLPINFDSFQKFLGWTIPPKEIIKNLSLLGFAISQRKNYLLVSPPLYRNDILTKEDAMAEVSRLLGFNNIPSLAPREAIILPSKNEFWEFINKIKDWLKVYHLEEVYTYSFISQKDAEILPVSIHSSLIELQNPLSDLYRYLRPTLLINLLKTVANNFRFTDKIRFFEIGNIYLDNKNK